MWQHEKNDKTLYNNFGVMKDLCNEIEMITLRHRFIHITDLSTLTNSTFKYNQDKKNSSCLAQTFVLKVSGLCVIEKK